MDARRIIGANLSELDREYESFCERRLAHIRELAIYMHGVIGEKDDLDLSSWLEAVRSLYRDTVSPQDGFGGKSGGFCESNRRGGEGMRIALRSCDRICLCSAILDTASRRLTVEDFLGTEGGIKVPNRISYLKNAYTDEAYSRFSAVLKEPTVTYCDDFAAVCEDVYYSRASLCIIPIENSVEGKLSAFRNLINKYELKIVMTCQVLSSDGSTQTRFALLKKNIERIQLLGYPKKTDMFEFSVILSETDQQSACLADILFAARYFGLILYKADSSPVSYSDTAYKQDLIFCIDKVELVGFICYLTFEAPQFVAVGIYPHLL